MASELPATQSVPTDVLKALQSIVGAKGWIDDASALDPYLREERQLYRGSCAAVVRPASTEEVADVVRICAEANVPIVPHGGNTGLVGGGVPQGGIIVSTARLNRIRDIDCANRTLTVEAGVILADVQSAADEAGLFFPLSLAAEGTCQIGGNLATNAGGVAVLRYGNARELALGLEVVLPDGRVWADLSGLRKDNTGYDLKHLFLGSEGTLGIITAAVLKLFPKPREVYTALAAVSNAQAAVELFQLCNGAASDSLVAFELIDQRALRLCVKNIPGIADPFDALHPCYTLIKLASPKADGALGQTLETVLTHAFEDGVVEDAVIAANEAQAAALWRLRESIPEAQKAEGGSIKNDISVPLSKVPQFLDHATAAVEAAIPGVRVVAFGHLGDGNIHFNLTQPKNADRDAFIAEWDRIERIVSDIADGLGGSFSAEHGVGHLKRHALARYKSPVALDLMHRVKNAIDPKKIMNPGKVLPSE